MSETSDEPRSWPDGAEADEAMESLKDGLRRVRSSVADFRRKISPAEPSESSADEPS